MMSQSARHFLVTATQVLAEILHSGAAEGPVDVVDDKTGLENNHVDGVVDWIGVFAMGFVLLA